MSDAGTTPGASSGPEYGPLRAFVPLRLGRSWGMSSGSRRGTGMMVKEQKKWASPALPPGYAATSVGGLGSLLLRKHSFAKAPGRLLGPLGNWDKSGYTQA